MILNDRISKKMIRFEIARKKKQRTGIRLNTLHSSRNIVQILRRKSIGRESRGRAVTIAQRDANQACLERRPRLRLRRERREARREWRRWRWCLCVWCLFLEGVVVVS
jgi:hypothetical protein